MKSFTFFLLSILVVISSTAELNLEEQEEQHEQNEEDLNPVNDVGTIDYQTIKYQDKRTIFGPKHYGWAKHVAISPSGTKYVVGYSPVDLKYIPVVKPIHLRPHYHHVHHQHIRPVYHHRPIVAKPLLPVRPPHSHHGGWKPPLPIIRPVVQAPPHNLPIVNPVHHHPVAIKPVHVHKPFVPSKPLIPITVAHPLPIALPPLVHHPIVQQVPIAPSFPVGHPVPVAHPLPVAPAVPVNVPPFPLSVLQQLPGAKFHTPGPGASIEYHGTYNFVPHVHAHPHAHLHSLPHDHTNLHVEPHVHPHLHVDQHVQPHLHLNKHVHPHAHLEPHLHPHLHLEQHVQPHLHLDHSHAHLQPHLHLDQHAHLKPNLHPHFHQTHLIPHHHHNNVIHDDGRHVHQVPVEEPQFVPQQPTLLQSPHPAHHVPINPNVNGQTLFQHQLPGNVHHAFSQQVNTDHSNVLIRQSLDIPNIHPGHTDLQIPVHLPQHPNYLPEGRHVETVEPQQPGVLRPNFSLEPPFSHK